MAVIQETLILNGQDLGEFGLEWVDRQGWRSMPDATVIIHELAGTDGLLFQESVENKLRRITVSGTILAATVAQLYDYINEVAARLNGFLEIQFSDDLDRFIGGYKQSADIGDYQPGALIPAAPFTFVFECPDPRRYDVAVTSVLNGAGCPLGTARVKPTIMITGPAANPTTIQLRDHNGDAVSSFTIAGALLSGESWFIDAELTLVRKDDGAGTVTNEIDKWSGEFPVLDPLDADWPSASWPYFEATAGAPASVEVTYKRAWK